MLYLICTMFSCYYRPDFMSLTALSGAFFFFEKPGCVRRSMFKVFVYFLCATFVFDFLHLFVLHSSLADDEADSGMTRSVRHFSYLFVWISFCFRPIVCVVMWRNYQDFMKLVKGKEGEANLIMEAMSRYGTSDILQAHSL